MNASAAAALLLAAVAAGPAAAQSIDQLLRDLAPADSVDAGEVRVEGRLERTDAELALVVRLSPVGAAMLVADPGIQVLAMAGRDGPWAAVPRVEALDPAGGYFSGPVELRLPVLEGAAGEAVAEVAYAWCRVERICLFGHATVSVPLPIPGG
ncbi:MAG: hypothetical protein N3D77_08140 [Geminicoccaceae bacterium]|nr:hypothetical protein [Geminicoccaceae bacterium]